MFGSCRPHLLLYKNRMVHLQTDGIVTKIVLWDFRGEGEAKKSRESPNQVTGAPEIFAEILQCSPVL